VRLTTISAKKFDKCENNAPTYTTQAVAVLAGTEQSELKKFEDLANIQGAQCKDCGCVATVPEWWQVRFEGGTPQIIISYQEVKQDGTLGTDWYPITIPHPKSTNKPAGKLTPDYDKGSWQILLTLKDNTKVILNTKTEQGGKDFMDTRIKPLIADEYLVGAKIKTAHFPDSGFKDMKVTNKHVDYYATGNRKMQSTWRVKL
jgi:hypothetical protein